MARKITTLTNSLKAAIKASDMTVYQISKESGVTQAMISRFLSDERDIRLATADKLSAVLGLELKQTKK